MSDARSPQRWILLAAAGSFLAGLAVGVVAPHVADAIAPEHPTSADAVYVRELVDRYDLGPDQARLIRMILEDREREHRRALLGDPRRLPPALRDELDAAKRRAEERIRFVLTDEQRERFLRDSEPAFSAGVAGPLGPADAEDR